MSAGPWLLQYFSGPGCFKSLNSLFRNSLFESLIFNTSLELYNGNPLQYSCLENPMDTGTWRATVHRVAKSRTRLSNFTFTSLSYIGEGNGNPLQCSCLESPRDGGAWWAAVYGVTQSRTGLKRLSSSRVKNDCFHCSCVA